MPKYLIERDIPGAGQLTAEELKGFPRNPAASCTVSGRKSNG